MGRSVTATGKFTAHVAEAVPEGFFEGETEFLGDAFDSDWCVITHKIRIFFGPQAWSQVSGLESQVSDIIATTLFKASKNHPALYSPA